MANLPFSLLEEPETRQPSKVRLILLVLFLLLIILSALFIGLYIIEKTKPTDSSPAKCSSAACITSAAAILNNLDETTKPCDDFYQYSCGGFLKRTSLPDGKDKIGEDTKSQDFIQNSLKDIFENEEIMSNYSKIPNSAVFKAFTFYKSCMNESYNGNARNKPILEVIEQYGSWSVTNKNWSGDSWILEKVLARMAVDLATDVFLAFQVGNNPFNTSEPLLLAISGGSSPHYLTEKNKKGSDKTVKNVEDLDLDFDKDYKIYMSTVFKLLGATSTLNNTIDNKVERVNQLEKDFLLINDAFNYQPSGFRKSKFMTLEELNSFTSYKFNWTLYLEEVFLGTGKVIRPDEKLMILLPNTTKKIVDFMAGKPKRLLANVIMWNAIRRVIPTLPVAFRDANDKYKEHFKINIEDRWKTCYTLTNNAFQYVTALLYVNEHLSEESLETTGELFTEIKNQFVNGLKEYQWIDDATRAQARLKLDMMKKDIGFPAFIKDPVKLNKYYEKVDTNITQLLQNQLSAIKDIAMKKLDTLGRPADDNRFLFPPLTVNAFYNPATNGMTVLAGILQPPFYKDGNLKALIYGSLGMIVGHEITHGFDKQGSQYDEKGNIRSWWTKKSHENFVNRSTCLIKQYNKLKIYGVQVDGNSTLSENIADNGGIKYAFRAYQEWRRKHGKEDSLPALSFNNDQLFFISFAQLWCEKYRKDKVESIMDADTHSLDPVRVRIPLHNFPEFSKAFGCTPPTDTCEVW